MHEATGHDVIWRALADKRRREILDLLADGPRTTGQVCDSIDGLCRTAVMKHLDVLVAAGLVAVRRRGRERFNEFDPRPIQRACGGWFERHRRAWERSFERLKRLAEDDQ